MHDTDTRPVTANQANLIGNLREELGLPRTPANPAGNPTDFDTASKLIGMLLERKRAKPSSTGKLNMHEFDSKVPAGKYALDFGPDRTKGTNQIRFYSVSRPDEGRWKGFVFVNKYLSDNKAKMSISEQYHALKLIAANPAEASARYGRLKTRCGICGRKLTNDFSRKKGIGPICAGKVGW